MQSQSSIQEETGNTERSRGGIKPRYRGLKPRKTCFFDLFMNSKLEIETGYAEQVASSVSPSLRSNERVDYSTETVENKIKIGIDADQLGVLRGCTDSVFRLIMLADKIYSKEV